jgi:HD-like signal output (HDOD) protein
MAFARTIEDLIDGTTELGALPSTTTRLLTLLDDDTIDVTRVLAIIGKDPGLTANLLKLCNSAYYGLRRQVGSVREALLFLGNKTVATLAFATSMGNVLRSDLIAYGLNRQAAWRHSLATGVAASQIAAAHGSKEMKDRAFTAGMVHDIGKLLLNEPLLKQDRQLDPGLRGLELMQVESEILGFDHCEAGAALATAWNFPPMLAAAILHHHQPDAGLENSELLHTVFAANLLAEGLDDPTPALGEGGAEAECGDTEALLACLTTIGLSESAVIELRQNLVRDLDQMIAILEKPA